jgi:hypothetical protein
VFLYGRRHQHRIWIFQPELLEGVEDVQVAAKILRVVVLLLHLGHPNFSSILLYRI